MTEDIKIEKKKAAVIIFHGLGCNGHSVWVPSLAEKLRGQGYAVWHPDLPNSSNPKAEEWVKSAEELIQKVQGLSGESEREDEIACKGEAERPLILIGHSLGGTLILHLLSKSAEWQKRLKHAYIFGAPSFTRPYTPDFWSQPMNWKEITKHSSKLTAVWSRDDDRVPEDHIKMIAENTEAQIEIVDGYGHFRDLENHWFDTLTAL